MKDTAIIYASMHHGNTEKLAKEIAGEFPSDIIDIIAAAKKFYAGLCSDNSQ